MLAISKPNSSENREPCDLPTPESTSSFWHSKPSALLSGHRSTRELPASADVVIIGSGMTGTGVAYNLLQRDNDDDLELDVVMLEAREACWGATGRNGGHCQPVLFEHPHEPSIGHFELKNFDTLQDLINSKDIDCEFVPQPGVRAIYSQRHLDHVELSLSIVEETAPELASRMCLVTDKDELNALRVPAALGAVVTDTAARMWPYKFVARMLEDLLMSTDLRGSFNLQTLTPVTKIHKPDNYGDVLVETDRGSIKAKKVVLATNAYTSHLLHGFADLIVPCRGQMSALVPFPSVSDNDRLRTSLGFMDDGVDDYLIQRPNETGAYLMYGGGRQYGLSMGVTDDSVVDENVANYLRTRLTTFLNLPEGIDQQDWRCDQCVAQESHCDRSAGWKSCDSCQSFSQTCTNNHSVAKSIQSAAINPMEAKYMWTGIMGFSRDERPWVGLVPGAKNVYMAAGFTGHGMPNAWLSGKTVALILQKTFAGSNEASAMKAASAETGLPESYRTSSDRIKRAMELQSVELVDWLEMERGRASERPLS